MSSAAISAILRSLKPDFRSPADRVAFAVHAWMLARGYKLIAMGNDAVSETVAAQANKPEIELRLQGDDHTLLYADAEASGTKDAVTVKLVALGGTKLLTNYLTHSAGAPQAAVLDVDVNAFTAAGTGVMDGYKDLPKLLQLLDDKFVGTRADTSSSGRDQVKHAQTSTPEEASSLLEEQQPRGAGGLRMPAPGTTDVGWTDLYPAGMDPLRDPVGLGRGPMMPGGGGMHVGPHDPMFAGGMRFPSGPRPGTLPPGGRWDPIAPPGMQGFNPDDFQRGPRPPFHPDVQPPGPGRGTDWDAMFG